MKIWSKKGEDIGKGVQEFLCREDILNDETVVFWDIVGSIAHTKALEKAGVLSAKESKELVTALRNLLLLHKTNKFKLDESLEDVHSNLEAWLTTEVGDLGKKIHTGRSRNDQAATDLALYSKAGMFSTCTFVAELCNTLLSIPATCNCPMPGYTHSRKAMISSVPHWLLAHCEILLNDLGLLLHTIDLIDKSPLGAAAGYGTIVPIDRKMTAKALGFSSPYTNTLAAIGSRGKNTTAILAALTSVMQTLSSFSTELILFSGEEFISLPKEYCTGSSIMPHKSNPDCLELIRAKAARLLGLQTGVAATVLSLPLGYHRDIQETKGALMEAFEITVNCISIMDGVVSGIEINEKACIDACTDEMCLADVATKMSMGGIPFRDAYRKVKKAKGELTDPKKNILQKKHLGAPGDKAAGKQLKKQLSLLKSKLEKKQAVFESAITDLLESPIPLTRGHRSRRHPAPAHISRKSFPYPRPLCHPS
ncbi:MAG: argininosuccinate lyase [Candidatus Micrarchaeota archaeon]